MNRSNDKSAFRNNKSMSEVKNYICSMLESSTVSFLLYGFCFTQAYLLYTFLLLGVNQTRTRGERVSKESKGILEQQVSNPRTTVTELLINILSNQFIIYR